MNQWEYIEDALKRHEGKVGFQFSGGRDSTAALYLLMQWWDRMEVYFLDTGDQFPETLAVVEAMSKLVPITRINVDVHANRQKYGLPTDLLPTDNTNVGQLVMGDKVLLQDRYDCCARSIMNPMHQRLIADGKTLIIRGQRDEEYVTPPMRTGGRDGAMEVLYPIQTWSGQEVLDFIAQYDLPLAPFYEGGMKHGSDCMGCTAWWDEGRSRYLRERHPETHKVFIKSMKQIKAEVDRQYATLLGEIDAPGDKYD